MSITEAQVKTLAEEAYDSFYDACCDVQIALYDGDKVKGLNAMQGFDWPDFLLTGVEMEDECTENEITIPEDAVGLVVYRSTATHGQFILTTDSENDVMLKLNSLYPEEADPSWIVYERWHRK